MGKITITLMLLLTVFCSFCQVSSKKGMVKDLSYYEWYGKRFDWMLDLYSRHPLHKDSINLFISEIGTGSDTFLVIHGGFGSEHSYLLDALLPLADKAHFIFYDQRGSLRSSCPDSLLSVENHVNDIERIRKALKVEHINIIAHSMGTLLAMNYMQKYPGKAGKVILVSSMPVKLTGENEIKAYNDHQRTFFESKYKEQGRWWPLALKKNGLDTSNFGRRLVSQSRYMYMQQFWAAVGKVYDYEFWDTDNNGSTFLYKANVAAVMKDIPINWDFTDAIKSHTFPVTVIKASDDYLSPEIVKRNIKGISNVRYIEIAKAGHNIWLEQPEKFKNAMSDAMHRK